MSLVCNCMTHVHVQYKGKIEGQSALTRPESKDAGAATCREVTASGVNHLRRGTRTGSLLERLVMGS